MTVGTLVFGAAGVLSTIISIHFQSGPRIPKRLCGLMWIGIVWILLLLDSFGSNLLGPIATTVTLLMFLFGAWMLFSPVEQPLVADPKEEQTDGS